MFQLVAKVLSQRSGSHKSDLGVEPGFRRDGASGVGLVMLLHLIGFVPRQSREPRSRDVTEQIPAGRPGLTPASQRRVQDGRV